MYLYEEIDAAKKFGAYKELPQFIRDNLNSEFTLRPYQKTAFCNFITYFENPETQSKQIHTLFHMATGSGKTLIMAGLMLYLYKQGYRNFLFFVNLSQIVKKTEDNFLNQSSSKYLFAPKIIIDGREIHINKVTNFQDCNPNDINILFDTTAGLHSDLFTQKENAPTLDDFLQDKTALIADEAHHLNASTKRGEINENETSWENTISKIRNANPQNVMLEFTATCDIANPDIKNKYEDKIIFDYPLKKFRADKYSKDIYTLRSDFPQDEEGRFNRILQALILSQYKLKKFQDIKLNVKPVVLLKSKTIKESEANRIYFEERLKKLNGEKIEEIKTFSTGSELMKTVFGYFKNRKIDNETLAEELKNAFSIERTIDVNNDTELEKNQILVNSLEDLSNPYRLIFEVEKLDEGWDCLNLFDIVRLYETRDAKDGKPGKSTVREAQLIGRGARYFPFISKDGQEKYKRKFDATIDEPLRICEQLHYHCQENSRYITELNAALREFGIDDVDGENKILRENKLKDEFKNDELYKNGFVFLNEIENKTFKQVSDISEIKSEYPVNLAYGNVRSTLMLDDGSSTAEAYELEADKSTVTKTIRKSFSDIAENLNYNFLRFNAEHFSFFTFENIKSLFPEVKSFKEFLTGEKYLGKTQVVITANVNSENELTVTHWNTALKSSFAKIADELSKQSVMQTGSKEFRAKKFKEVFADTKRYYTNPHGDGEGVSQSNCSNDLQFDLNSKDWYVYCDNFGTTEEKKFVKWFSTYIPQFEEKYSKIKLVRNELQAAIYSFNDGRRFEPDFLLFLKNRESNQYEYMQIFFEPKGKDLLLFDSWKEEFLLELKNMAVPVVQFKTDSKYNVWGTHFYCSPERDKDITNDIEEILNVHIP